MRQLVRMAAAGTVATALLGLAPMGQAVGQSVPSAGAAATNSAGLVYRGSTNLGRLAAQARAAVPNTSQPASARQVVGPANRPALAAVPVPNPPTTAVVHGRGGAPGFVAITAAQQAAANGGQDVEPPDQGLCAHAGQMIEPVNDALQAYSENGAALSPVVDLNSFFALPPSRSASGAAGPFISDPRCYYDGQTGRWFITALEIDVNPYSGTLGYRSSELLAVSQTSDPLGSYGLFMIDTTDDGTDGTMALSHCPCFGDQPRIGADTNGFYISADIYPIHGTFNSDGGDIWALSKPGLAAAVNGKKVPTLVTLYNGATTIRGYPANAVQPAETPEGGAYAPNREYFLSTPDFNGFATSGGVGARSVVLWTLAGTSTLGSSTPAVTLSDGLVPSEPYATPVNATQKPGRYPLGRSLKAALPPISVNDDRMQQVEFTGGRLYSSLNTGIGPAGTADRSGVAWFSVDPGAGTGTMADQGYLAVGGGATLLYPAIGLTPAANGVMTFSVSGPNQYPSHAYVDFTQAGPSGSIYIDGPGAAPEDGFTCYKADGFGPACRWGDYSAASSDGQGHVVMGAEMIPNTARDRLANWGTLISVRAAS
jgi:hypothetical protein